MSELESKIFLAKQMPEEIAYWGDENGHGFVWVQHRGDVTSREWDYITKKVCILRNFAPSCPTNTWEQQAKELYEFTNLPEQN